MGARPKQYVGMKKDQPLDISSPAIWRDPNKCVLCGRCVTMCHEIQGIGAIDFIDRGFRTQVGPGFYKGINVSGCTYCGQCVRVCPTGALMERSHVDDVVAALADPDTVVVAQIAPAVPATLAAARSKPPTVPVMLEHLTAALKRIGVAAVFDTAFAADLTIMEEATELVERLQNGGTAPHVHQLLSGLGQLRRATPAGPDPPPVHLQVAPADGRGADQRGLPGARRSG